MNHSERISIPVVDALVAGIAAAWMRVAGIAAALSALRAREAAIRDLQRLGDRTLRDIGLHRSQIRAAVEGRLSS